MIASPSIVPFLSRALALACTALLFSAVSLCAVVPEPGNIYYGLARNIYGQVLTPEDGARVVMVRVSSTNEFVMAVSEILPLPINGPAINYILRPSLDDGVGVRYLNEAGRSNEVIQIYVVQNGFRFAVTNSPSCVAFSEPVPRLGGRGAIFQTGVKANDDFDSDCLSDAWEIRYYGNTTDCVPGADDDSDGYSNLAEYLMNTDPTDPSSSPGQELLVEVAGIAPNAARLQWPRFLGVPDLLQWSSVPVGGFSNVPPDRISGFSSNIVNTTGRTNLFFRVQYQTPR